jgi:hypothetical protein
LYNYKYGRKFTSYSKARFVYKRLWSEYFDTGNKTVSVNQFVENNINKPMIDVKRCREISNQIMNEDIQEDKALNEFTGLLEKESSAKDKYIKSLAHSQLSKDGSPPLLAVKVSG